MSIAECSKCSTPNGSGLSSLQARLPYWIIGISSGRISDGYILAKMESGRWAIRTGAMQRQCRIDGRSASAIEGSLRAGASFGTFCGRDGWRIYREGRDLHPHACMASLGGC